MINLNFGIPFEIDGSSFEVRFLEGVQAEEIKEKYTDEMVNLFYNIDNTQRKLAYKFYANIYNDSLRKVYQQYGYTNGITAVMPERINGECLKNSGHYHLISEEHSVPYMECYEILQGTAAFLLQKTTNLSDEDNLQLEDCVVVIMKERDKLIVPPYYAHSAVNIGQGPMLFGNLAAPCPVNYAPISKHHGFFAYMFDIDGQHVLVQNNHYKNMPKIRFVRAKESEKLGISRDISLNESFMKNPEKFRYLQEPEEYIKEVEALLEGKV